MNIAQPIEACLSAMETEHNVRVLYAYKAGSRRWEGLPNPIMRHLLFSITPLGQLAPPLDHKTDLLLDTAFARFSAEHPLTMTLEDLPELREKQGHR